LAKLSIEHTDRRDDRGAEIRVVAIKGSVDSSTAEQFDRELTQVLSGRGRLAVLNFAEAEYVNSRGMALLVKHHDLVKGSGGKLVIAGLPRKIAATFEVMGLNATFTFAADEKEAIGLLVSGAGTGGGAARFPVSFACDACGAPLRAGSQGRYRCPRCQGCFEVSADGQVITFPLRSAQSVEMSFPCRAKYADAARAAAASVAKDVELSSITAELLDRAVDEVLGLYAGKSADGQGRIRMLVAADSREFAVAFLTTDPGLELDEQDQQGLTIKTLRSFVDQVDILPLSPEGQMLKLVKRIEQ